jgi:hypothetical protein
LTAKPPDSVREPVPVPARLGARVAYRLQRALRPNPGYRAGRTADLRLLHRPADNRRWGASSWLNYWQGRDEQLWTGDPGAGP